MMGNTIPHGDRLHECSPTCLRDALGARPVDPAAQKPDLHLRHREGDQPLPVPNDQESCQARFMDRVNKMAPARMELGKARYGTLLQPFNGRDFVQDVFEELFDAWAYFEGVAAEREAMLELLRDVAGWRLAANEGSAGIAAALRQSEVTAEQAQALLTSMGHA